MRHINVFLNKIIWAVIDYIVHTYNYICEHTKITELPASLIGSGSLSIEHFGNWEDSVQVCEYAAV